MFLCACVCFDKMRGIADCAFGSISVDSVFLYLELHSPLMNSLTEARRAELELEWSTRLCREHKPDKGHLTHTIL